MDAAGFGVNSGNFRMCSVNGGKIIAAVELHDRNGAYAVENERRNRRS